ncbi:MAG: M23 family metallopeptidase [Aquabacterium sp.]
MQIMITHGSLARTRVLHLSRLRLAAMLAALVLVLVMLSGTVYHMVFLKAAREGWPLVSQLVKLVVRDEIEQRDRVMRDNLDALAQRVGELQAKLVKLEAIGERVSVKTGIQTGELKPKGGQGGSYLPLDRPGSEDLQRALVALDERADLYADIFTLFESRLLESRLRELLLPSVPPVDGPIGSGFGFRSDPITLRTALHSGLDFPADIGTPVIAAAGGVVVAVEWHAQYGHVMELDHGRDLSTRYAHLSRIHVKQGDVVKRGQRVADVGNSGRSTGPHLHFEVLVQGIPQDPMRFLEMTGHAEARQAGRGGRR